MSKWWEVTVGVPEGAAGTSIIRYVVAAESKKAARAKAVGELSKKYSRIGIIEARILADEEEDETIGGFDEEGELPRQTPTKPRLVT